MIERAGFIPQLAEDEVIYETINFENKGVSLNVEVPALTAVQIGHIIEKVKKTRNEVLTKFTVADMVAIVDEVVHRLLDRNNAYRKKAEKLLPIVTGYDAEMIRLGLTSSLKTFRKPQLLKFLVEDFGNPMLLDEFQPVTKGGYVKAIGPQLMTHIWAGNVPGLPLWSLVSSLLVKGGSVGKVSSSEPLFAGWVAQMLAEVEPKLKDCLAIVWWRGGDEEKEVQLFEASDVVLAYGGNTSLSAMKSRVPVTTRFLPYGHKMAFSLIASESLNARNAKETAHRAAFDVINYDQQACFSPHAFFVQRGGSISPKDFSEYIACELDKFDKRHPRKELSFEEEASIASWKQKEEISLFSRLDKAVLSKESGSWTVIYEQLPDSFTPSPLNRTVRIIEVDDFEQVIPILIPYRKYLQTAGIAAHPKEMFKLSSMLAEVGVTRIASIGKMTSPQAGWHHDGTSNLLDLVRVVDIEHDVEYYADKFSPYRS
ncbi:acyl-CoA reductase [Oceanisphaera arctica]|uniref:Acyl-CoA reductase n=1 Tax=Oceanisphaera arctica TaxID=641510 RepID=A0A2P5TPU5_9GAMM|nr:acyl-CoA reductase [Oceanisphaera arctica]PPL17713.1 acyl-CoA reductase [Oceanisphaera arctica]GHA18486.1 acyl-CoA reductase [Oceanisphaera arctica]